MSGSLTVSLLLPHPWICIHNSLPSHVTKTKTCWCIHSFSLERLLIRRTKSISSICLLLCRQYLIFFASQRFIYKTLVHLGAKPHLFSLISKVWKSLLWLELVLPFKCIVVSFKLPVVSSTFKIFVRRKILSSFLEVLAGQLYFDILTTVGRRDSRQLTQYIGLLSLFFLDNLPPGGFLRPGFDVFQSFACQQSL